MLGLALVLALGSVGAIDRAVQLWDQSCARPDATGLCAELGPADSPIPGARLTVSGIDLECRAIDGRAYVTTRRLRSRAAGATQAVALLERATTQQLRNQDPRRWARARLTQGDALYEQALALVGEEPLRLVKVSSVPADDDVARQRKLERARVDADRKNAQANRIVRTRLQNLFRTVAKAHAIYEDVRLHGLPKDAVIALMRLGQLDADTEQAVGTMETDQVCATRANWATWDNGWIEPPDRFFGDHAKAELLFCREEAKRQMLVDELNACEAELYRIAPDEYPLPSEIAPQAGR